MDDEVICGICKSAVPRYRCEIQTFMTDDGDVVESVTCDRCKDKLVADACKRDECNYRM